MVKCSATVRTESQLSQEGGVKPRIFTSEAAKSRRPNLAEAWEIGFRRGELPSVIGPT